MIRLPVPARLASSALAIVAAVGVTACGGGSPSAAPGSPTPTSGSPAASDAVAGRTIRIEMTDAGCPPLPASIAAGPVTFVIVNKDATKSSEAELVQGDRILGEKENLTPACRRRSRSSWQPATTRCTARARPPSGRRSR